MSRIFTTRTEKEKQKIRANMVAIQKRRQENPKLQNRTRGQDFVHRVWLNRGAMIGFVVIVILILISVFADQLVDYEKDVIGANFLNRLQPPSREHLFGTDEMGRDIFSRILYGTRYSLSIGIFAVIIGVIVGVILGASAGYFGGFTEDIIMRVSDIIQSIPSILLAMAIVAALGAGYINLIIACAITSIPGFVRITRSAVLMVQGQEYIDASKAIGLPEWKIILRHIIPNSLSPIIVTATLLVAGCIISASSLSFLGLGVPAPAPEWGSMLSGGREYIRQYPYITFFPGLAIMITVLAFNLMGDGVRDALDPKLKR